MKQNFLGKGSLCGLMLALLLSGCTKDDMEGGNSTTADGLTRISLMPDQTEQIVMRSLGNNVNENAINNVWAIQLDASGNVVTGDDGSKLIKRYSSSEITAGTGDKGGTITMRVDPETAKVCFVANTTADFDDVTNLAGIESMTKTILDEQDLTTENNSTYYLPMAGTWEPKAGEDNTVELLRAVSKLTVTLAFDPETVGDGFALSSIQIKQVAKTLHFYRDESTIEKTTYPTLTATTDYAATLYDGSSGSETEGVVDLADEWDAAYMPTGTAVCKGKIIDNSTSKPEFSWYLPENARGTGTATNQWEKNANTAPSGQADYCTYLEIEGFYLTDGLVEEVVYRIYLGGNNTNDYNLLRNRHYILTATIKDKKLVDTRITEYTPQNYIDYTDNDSPRFVAAAREDGNANWETPVVDEDWFIPSIQQMMIAYAYNPTNIYGTNIYWLNLKDDTYGRWSINMSIGEVLPNRPSGDVQSYMLRAVKSYTGSDTYPYVDGADKNIIVSRDKNGGVKEDYIRDPATTPWTDVNYDHKSEQNKVAKKLEIAPVPSQDETTWVRRTWSDAKTYCENYVSPDGKSDWRMPTQRELMLIYALNDELGDNYKFKIEKFADNDTPDDEHPELASHIYYWSGTDDGTTGTGDAWSVCFCNDEQTGRGKLSGKTEGYDKNAENFVRPVRDVTE